MWLLAESQSSQQGPTVTDTSNNTRKFTTAPKNHCSSHFKNTQYQGYLEVTWLS